MSAVIIGIDPGLTGAIAILSEDADPWVFDMPTLKVGKGRSNKRDYAVPLLLDLLRPYAGKAVAAVELVHVHPHDGKVGAFKFGEGMGILKASLAACNIPFSLVPPQQWQKAIMAGHPRGKDANRLRAMQLFPQIADQLRLKAHSGRADALLIAEFWRRQQERRR